MVMWYNTDMEKWEIMEVFLERLAETGNVVVSAEGLPVTHASIRGWYDRDAQFAEAWDEAIRSYDGHSKWASENMVEEMKEGFLGALALTGSVVESQESVGTSRPTVYKWRKVDEEFREAWDEALLTYEQREAALILGWNGQRATVTDRQERLELMREVCQLVEETNNITEACRRLNLSRAMVGSWMVKNEAFALAIREAKEGKVDDLEAEVYRRGMTESDRAALAYLKAHRRETWGDQVDVNVGQKVVTLVWPEQEIVEGEVRELEDSGKLEDSGDVI